MACSSEPEPEQEVQEFRNLGPDAKYVGIETCGQCHVAHYQGFSQTGMGQSIDTASKEKSRIVLKDGDRLYDQFLDLEYFPHWEDDALVLDEFRTREEDTIHFRSHPVNYIIGSGQHTNSHLWSYNGYVHQMPFTYYTQNGKLDFPPGFEDGFNSRFSRVIGLECMSCHNAKPDFEVGSINKFNEIPNGINCERCHGPGSIHVKEKLAGIIIDTAKFTDYSIVNPAKLSLELQFEICQRCHLQGNAVLQEGKSFHDFRPGMKLSDVMDVYVANYSDADEAFIMASHVDRLKKSNCFIESDFQLNCFTCHNPHKSVTKTKIESFNAKCASCHKPQNTCTEDLAARELENNNCVACHMPKSGSVDIPHVSITDHSISIPVAKEKLDSIKTFVALNCVNNSKPNKRSRILAFLQQYERFESDLQFLDSAKVLLEAFGNQDAEEKLHLSVYYHFLRNDYRGVINDLNELGQEKALSSILTQMDYANRDAWTSYRIAQSFDALGKDQEANMYYLRATKLGPYILDFWNKLGTNHYKLGDIASAKDCFTYILNEYPYHVEALNNLGFMYQVTGIMDSAIACYQDAIGLDPNYTRARYSLIGIYGQQENNALLFKELEELMYLQPENADLQNLYRQLKSD